ncbi:MAG: SRPBCC family protein [Bacteroidales bacterium]|nr:SRPBCC family protein [Bacteroidales bacterium]
MTVESKTVDVPHSAQEVYAFASNFENYSRLIPPQVEGWQATADTCSFKVGGFVQLSMRIEERCPYTLVSIAPDGATAVPLHIKLEIGEKGASSSVRILVDVEGGNPMITMMLKPKLKEAVDKIVDQLKYI